MVNRAASLSASRLNFVITGYYLVRSTVPVQGGRKEEGQIPADFSVFSETALVEYNRSGSPNSGQGGLLFRGNSLWSSMCYSLLGQGLRSPGPKVDATHTHTHTHS